MAYKIKQTHRRIFFLFITNELLNIVVKHECKRNYQKTE